MDTCGKIGGVDPTGAVALLIIVMILYGAFKIALKILDKTL